MKATEMHVHALPRFQARRTDGHARATFTGRVRVWWHASDLDRRLAAGTHSWGSQELSLRASQLARRDQRVRLARALEHAVATARAGPCDRSFAVPLQRGAIVSGADDLLALAAALRSSADCRPHAAALASFLVRDGSSPLYDREARATPANLARAAITGFTDTAARR